jgi:predicted unusual protein kinase regulating ubiquinone biosynthesis (AarF/ABC1/UbiB family)
MRLSKTLKTIVETRVKWRLQPNSRLKIAQQARQELTDLGPTFVKIGQYISTREDLFPVEIVEEFSSLQDNVQPFEWVPEEGLCITDVDPVPLAAASLGQVHKCKYKGQDCVVKVLRPGVREQVENDVRNLLMITKLFEVVNPSGSRDLSLFVKELNSMLKMETDYKLEAQNTLNFRKNFSDIDWVIIPDVYYATKNILVMEYISSQKITEATGYNGKSLAWALTKSQIMQVLRTGFFHGDPHPGNVGVKDGKLVYYDFGMVSEISIKQKKTLMALLFAITNENEEQILAILNNLGIVSSDPTGLRSFVRFFLEYIKKNEFTDTEELLAIKNNPLEVSGSFFYLIRSFGLIEGISKKLDPTYKSSELLQKYAEESDEIENAMMTSLQNTFQDMSGVSYRLSNIEKRVKKQQETESERNLILLIILLLTFLENDWIIGLFG